MMKKTTLLIGTLCATALIYVSCSSNDDSPIVNQNDIAAVPASIAIDAATEMDVNTGLFVSANTSIASKTNETPTGICATIAVTTPTAEPYPKVITVDYGTTGCKDNEILRKGKLKITLSGPITTTGSKMTIERIDYSINAVKLEGTIEYTNTTTVSTTPQWTRKVTNGKLTDASGKVYFNEGTCTVQQTAGVETPLVLADNVYEMTSGSHTVTASSGAVLYLSVQETLVKKYSCLFISKGKLKIQGGLLNGVVDYGNNDCDSRYTYTHENGLVYDLLM